MRKQPKYLYFKSKYNLWRSLCETYIGLFDFQHDKIKMLEASNAQRGELIMELQKENISLRKQLKEGGITPIDGV
jgi:hypothetical protein